jgi:xanthine dehydrogenase accessory factor
MKRLLACVQSTFVLDLFPVIFDRIARGERLALCTVVRTRGSAPQSAGAAMVVTAAGQTQGTLGGGCVEAEVRHRALRLLQDGKDQLLTFRLDNDYGWDDGLVCGGIMDIAVQILDADVPQTRHLQDAAAQLSRRTPSTLRITAADETGAAHAFELPLTPPPILVIAGAGHVGQALARIAQPAGFEIVVIDDRPDLATPERFAGAKCMIGEIDHLLCHWPIDIATYVVIVTRGHRHDGDALAAVIDKPAAYVGLIGSKRKVRRILEDLHSAGAPIETLSRVRSPIGLAIGAVTPGEIAISIAAELIATRRGALLPAGPMQLTRAALEKWLTRPRVASLPDANED